MQNFFRRIDCDQRVEPGSKEQRQGFQRGVNAWNALPGKVVAAETGKFKMELEIKGCMGIDRTGR